MKPFTRLCALLLLVTPLAESAVGQQWQAPSAFSTSATYDPAAGAVLLPDRGRATQWTQSGYDPAVRPAVHQPPGRVYAVSDPFAVTAPPAATTPQTVTVGQPTWTAPATPAAPAPGYATPSYAAPGYTAPVYGAPACPPAAVAPCPPIDPYACGPAYQYQAPMAVAPVAGPVAQLRQAYSEIEGRTGDPPEAFQTNLFLPFCQEPDAFWFYDLRAQYDDNRAGEGNFGIARRRLIGPDLIMGYYGFYDIRHTQFDNNFQQATVGFEMLTLDWEYRINGYLPFTGTKPTGVNVASLVDDNIVVQQGLERAYYGVDAEIGRVLARFGGAYDHEIRGFVGGFYFDTDAVGFRSFGGPRARLEGRFYDLPCLGAGSRFTYGATYQWDEVRESQWVAFVNLRIPFGPNGAPAGARLTPIERRMVSPIRRDEAIVTGGALSNPEQAVISSTGVVATNVTEINNGATAAADVAGGSNIAVVTANINSPSTIVLNPDQFLGGRFRVHGQNTGAAAIFGARRTVNVNGADVIQIAHNTTVTGLNITGDQAGIVGGADDTVQPPDADPDPDGVAGFTISNNSITASGGAGIDLDGVVQGNILGNTITSGGVGLDVDTFTSGEISGNTANNLAAYGFLIGSMSGGTVSGNTANGNSLYGFLFGSLSGGTVSGNTANGNGQAGIYISAMSGGTVSGNTANNSGFDGFYVTFMEGGTISGNTARANGDEGFDFVGPIFNGAILSNVATGNGVGADDGFGNGTDGFFFNTIAEQPGDTVNIEANSSIANNGDGFEASVFMDGTFQNNTANNNTALGYNFPVGYTGTAVNNGGSGNAGNNTLP